MTDYRIDPRRNWTLMVARMANEPDALIKAIETGTLPYVDANEPFRSSVAHKAFMPEIVPIASMKDCWQVDTKRKLVIRVHNEPRVSSCFPRAIMSN